MSHFGFRQAFCSLACYPRKLFRGHLLLYLKEVSTSTMYESKTVVIVADTRPFMICIRLARNVGLFNCFQQVQSMRIAHLIPKFVNIALRRNPIGVCIERKLDPRVVLYVLFHSPSAPAPPPGPPQRTNKLQGKGNPGGRLRSLGRDRSSGRRASGSSGHESGGIQRRHGAAATTLLAAYAALRAFF